MEDYSELLNGTWRSRKGWSVALRMVELDPFVPIFLNRITENHVREGNLDAALQQARKVLEVDPESKLWTSDLVDIHLVRGEIDFALAVIDEGKTDFSREEIERMLEWVSGPDIAPGAEVSVTLTKLFYWSHRIGNLESERDKSDQRRRDQQQKQEFDNRVRVHGWVVPGWVAAY